MTEWDAMADFLEESGHPEWSEMARKESRRVEREEGRAAARQRVNDRIRAHEINLERLRLAMLYPGR